MNFKIIIMISFLSSTIFSCAMQSIDAQIEVLKEKRAAINRELEKDCGGNSTAEYKAMSKYSTPNIDAQIKMLEKAKEKMKSKL